MHDVRFDKGARRPQAFIMIQIIVLYKQILVPEGSATLLTKLAPNACSLLIIW